MLDLVIGVVHRGVVTAVTDVFAPHDPAFVADPYPAYAELRAGARIARSDATGQWLVPRHADVSALLRDRRLGRTYLHVATHAEMGHPEDPPHLEPFWRVVRDGMLDREPPDHTRLRRLVSAAFTPRRVEALRPGVQAVADRLVDELLDAGSDGSQVDLLATVAEPLPVTVIAEMLGIPEGDRHLLRPWSADICGMYELDPSRETADRAVRACEEFADYLAGLARTRRRHPGDDLVSGLTQVVDDGDRLSEGELVGTCVLLLNAGHEATVNVTGNGWWSLFRWPDQLAALRTEVTACGVDRTAARGDLTAPGGQRSDLLATAVEELLRYDTPLQMFERWVLEDIEVAGVHVPRGEEVALLFGSANRDPEVFADPDRLDLARAPNPHVSFGAGVHFCLGAALARLELVTSFGTVLRRVPRLALAAEPTWKPGYVIRGLTSLPVTV